MKISQKMIAELSGVSRGTVDRVLHGKPNVNPETRKKVLEAIKKLDYSPNMVGRALAFSGRCFSICAVLPDNSFFAEVKAGIVSAVKELNDYNLSISFIYTNAKSVSELISELEKVTVNAFMLAVSDTPEIREWINCKSDAGVPVITFNTDVKDCGRLCFVGQDLYKSGRIAASLMLKMLYKSRSDILVVTGSNGYLAHRERVKGFTDVINTCKSARIVDVIETNDDAELMHRLIPNALKRYRETDGIYVAAGDTQAFAQIIKNSEKKYRIVINDLFSESKEQLKSGGFDFTILQEPFVQGYKTVKLLFNCLFCNQYPEKEYYYTNNTVITGEML